MAKMDEFREEREAMKNAPLKERLAYFWEYNKLETMIAIFAIVSIISITVTVLGKKDVLLEGMILNRFWMEMEGVDCESITQDYMEYREMDPDQYDLMLNGSLNYFPGKHFWRLEDDIVFEKIIINSGTDIYLHNSFLDLMKLPNLLMETNTEKRIMSLAEIAKGYILE